MTLFYVIGGGLGHLLRTLAVTHTLGISDFRIITASQYAIKLFGMEHLSIIPVFMEKNKKVLKNRIKDLIEELKPDKLIIDTFPFGILGEIGSLALNPKIETVYIARLLNFEKYMSHKKGDLKFNLTYIVEKGIGKDHDDFIQQRSNAVRQIELSYPDIPSGIIMGDLPQKKPIWLVMHSGPSDEVDILIRQAREVADVERENPFIWVVTQSKINEPVDKITMDQLPAYHLFQYADRLFSACGFNMMYLTRNLKIQHQFIPFPRKYDDQFLRARVRRIKEDK